MADMLNLKKVGSWWWWWCWVSSRSGWLFELLTELIIWKTFRGGADLIADEAENGASGTIYEDQWISFLRESP